jgi:serine/threonine-protein kinase
VHRDVKPENLMLHGESPGVKLLDFGISRWAESEEHDLTGAGELVGTGAYMAPEQFVEGGAITPAVDVYALGLTLFECLAGEHPLASHTLPQMMRAHIRGDLPSLQARAPLVDVRATKLVDAMIALEPARRPSLAEVRARLAELVPAGVTPLHAFESLGIEVGSDVEESWGDGVDTADAPVALESTP